MKQIIWISVFFGAVTLGLLLFSKCTLENEEDYFGIDDSSCDTVGLTYGDFTYIFTDICTQCHSESFTYRDEIKMDSYENVVSSINTGLVWPSINHEDGVPPMPNGLPKLEDCEITKIGAWINDSMPQ